ncbi:MAG: hypothetical protein HQL24_07695 [Candidatus Omnitrophica bacterium]|nr:hypothetical protein [Candidatus Omnitrophota bacterium]
MSESIEKEKTYINYLKILFMRKHLIIIPGLLGLFLGICASMILPKEYSSSTTLLVEEGKSDNPLFDKLAVATSIGQRVDTIKESMLGWNSLVELVKRLKMDKDVKTSQDYEDLILGIRKKMSIRLKSRNIIQLSYLGKDPLNVRDVVKNITEIFIDRNLRIQNGETADAIVFMEGQLRIYKGKVKSSEIAAIKDQLNALLVDSTEMHPAVKQLREQLRVKEEELRKENLEYTEDSSNKVATGNPLITEIKKALDNIEGKSSGSLSAENKPEDIYKVMLIDKLDSAVARDENVNTKIYNMLLERLEIAKMTQRLQMSNEGTRYTILDPPRVPLTPSKPNKVLVTFIGLILGVGIGAGLVFLMEFLDRSFLDVEEASKFFEVPLIGAISRIVTVDIIRIRKERIMWLYVLTSISGFALMMVAQTLSKFVQ